jgi:hypothetical protein
MRRVGRAAVRCKVGWLVALPLAVASWLNAHCLAYLLVPPEPGEHAHLHSASEHASFAFTPLLIAVGVLLVAVGVAVCADEGLRGRLPEQPSHLLFALLPALGFVAQEHLERFIRSGSIPYDLFAEPVFLVGLSLQLPLAVAALLLARRLYALGYSLGRVLAGTVVTVRPARRGPLASVLLPRAASIAAPSVLALGHGQRAPPAGRLQ